MNESDMKKIKECLETVLCGLENDIYRLQGIIAIGKDALSIENCEDFEELFNTIYLINNNLECVEFLKRR